MTFLVTVGLLGVVLAPTEGVRGTFLGITMLGGLSLFFHLAQLGPFVDLLSGIANF